MPVLGQDYIRSFLRGHPYDYAQEPIIYPRVPYTRRYSDATIQQGFQAPRFPLHKANGEPVRGLPIKPITPGMLTHHLYASRRQPRCSVESYWSKSWGEERQRYRGPRWLLASYYPYHLVDFIQIDIDRHGERDSQASEEVSLLSAGASQAGCDVVWTTSPGSLSAGECRHGLYGWIRLNEYCYVEDIYPGVCSWLRTIGLGRIVDEQEGAYLRAKRLVRLPGQLNVERACPFTFQKEFNDHDAVQASLAFQERWSGARRLEVENLFNGVESHSRGECLLDRTPGGANQPSLTLQTHSGTPPHWSTQKAGKQPPSDIQTYSGTLTGNTFTTLLQWGSRMVNDYVPNNQAGMQVALFDHASIHLPESSTTRQNQSVLNAKVRQVVQHLFRTYDPTRKSNGDQARFAKHAEYLVRHRDHLIEHAPPPLREPIQKILSMMLAYDGRIAVKMVYHDTGTPICTKRQWKRIQSYLGLTTLVDYEAPYSKKGTCRQYGFAGAQGESK